MAAFLAMYCKKVNGHDVKCTPDKLAAARDMFLAGNYFGVSFWHYYGDNIDEFNNTKTFTWEVEH